MGNAALVGIRAYQVPEIDVPGLPITIAPPTTSLVVGDIPQSMASVGLAQIGLSASVQPMLSKSLAAARTSVSGGYAPVEYAPPPGTVTLPGIVVTPNGSYQRATPEEEAAFARSYELNLSWQNERAESARVQATRARLAAENATFENNYAAWQKQDSWDVLKMAAMGPVGGALGVAAAASPWVAGALSVYNGYEGVRSIESGHPLWGAFQIATGAMGFAGAAPTMVSDVRSTLSTLRAPMLGSNALVDSEVSALQRIAAKNSLDNGSVARMVRIDELATANYNRILNGDLARQDYVYRMVDSRNLRYYEAAESISGPRGMPTYFSLDTAPTLEQHVLGAQMKPGAYDTLLRIPTSELVSPAVPRPFGYPILGQPRPTFGREYFTNSYPQYGQGGFRQFEATTKSYSPSWIVQ